VKIKNFRGYGENIDRKDRCFVFDDLDAPLVVFKGYNGFGKTSFFEAIEWCLTDKVYRLEKLYDNKTYQAHELRKSHYLKFYHPTQGSSSNREIYVELTFSNGFRVVRKTLSNVLRTTEKDNSYQSTLLMGYKDLKTATNKEVLHEFIYNSRDSEAFFRTHMLGQENINDFLRHNSPSQRREIFMQLLQESKLNDLLTKIKGHNIHTSKLNRNLREYNQKKEQYEKYQELISRFIKNLNFSNIGLYLESIQQYFLHIKLLMKKNPISDVLNFESLNSIEEINLKTINPLFEKLIFKEKKINNINEGFITKKEDLIRNQKEIIKLFLLENTKKNLINSHHANRLLEANLKDLQKKLDEHTTNISALKTKEATADAQLNTLFSYKNLFISLSQEINLTELFIDDQTWDNIKNEKVKYTTFFSHYHSLIQKLNHSSEINVDVEGYDSSRDFYEELLKKRKALIDKLKSIQKLKSEISTLNEQYQLALTSMKQFVSSNPEKISECPVCLNDDFSNPKYSSKGFKSWDDSLSTSNKILAIIDSTFASGDKKVDTFSKQESDVQESLERTKTEIKDVLQEFIDSLRITRTLFENQYAELEKHLRDNLQNVRNDLEQENEKQSLISEQIEKIKGSITLLFGDNYEIDQISEINLKDIIKENNDWLIENKDELFFLNGNINLTFIDTEISLLKEKNIGIYNRTNLPEDIQEITKNIEYLSDLSQKINQLIKYKVPVEYESSLANYDQLGSEINRCNRYTKRDSFRSNALNTFANNHAI